MTVKPKLFSYRIWSKLHFHPHESNNTKIKDENRGYCRTRLHNIKTKSCSRDQNEKILKRTARVKQSYIIHR